MSVQWDVGRVSEETFLVVETLVTVRCNRSKLCVSSLSNVTEILGFDSFKN